MITIGNRTLGPGKPCLVVAELGTGHLGSMGRARELVDAAAEAGADCAKFQLVYADEILHPLSGAVDLPTGRVELYQRFRQLEQPVSFYREIKAYVESKGLLFLCSPFGPRSARELRGLGVAALKIASPELNHFPLLEEAAGFGLPLILSSGVSTLADIERALEVTGRDRVVLLQCITAYPAPEEEYNVSLLASLQAVFGVEVGLSDHSIDPVLVPALAVLHGARVVEKHIALSRGGSGLDDPIALEPASFARMVRAIREAEAAGPADTLHRLEKDHGADRVRRLLGEHGVEISGLGYYPNPLAPDPAEAQVYVDHLKAVIRASQLLGVGRVNTFVGRDWTKTVDAQWGRFLETWRPLVAYAEQHEVRIGIENCPMLFSRDEWPGGKNLATSPAIWRRMFADIPSASFGLNFDPSHFVWQRMDYLKPLREFKDRIFHVHAKDVRLDPERLDDVGTLATPLEFHRPKLPGLGEVDWGRFFSVLSDNGYDGPVCVEVEDRAYEGSLELRQQALRQSLGFLRNFA